MNSDHVNLEHTIRLRLVLAVVSVLALGGCGASGIQPSANAAVPTSDVAVVDDDFDPEAITVGIGTEVTWTWKGSNDHNVVADNGAFESPSQAVGTFTQTFDKPGHRRLPLHAARRHGRRGRRGRRGRHRLRGVLMSTIGRVSVGLVWLATLATGIQAVLAGGIVGQGSPAARQGHLIVGSLVIPLAWALLVVALVAAEPRSWDRKLWHATWALAVAVVVQATPGPRGHSGVDRAPRPLWRGALHRGCMARRGPALASGTSRSCPARLPQLRRG